MNESKKIIEIIEPSNKVFKLYDYFESKIKHLLPEVNVRLIGSFAVPMCGKKEIDILIETKNVEETQEKLKEIGFSKGPIIKEEGFSINRQKELVCELHIVPFNHKIISKVYDKTINALKENKKLRKEYEKLKRSLNGKEESEYKKAKHEFLAKNIFNQNI